MHKSLFRCVFLVLFTLASSSLQAKTGPADVYTYREMYGEKTTFFSWSLQQENHLQIISAKEQERVFTNTCSADGATLEWQLKDSAKQHNITARRRGNTLRFSGIYNGNSYMQTAKLDERPWYQPLSYSLHKFLDSAGTATSFWIIRADTLEVVAMRAKKKGDEEITIDGRRELATKVEIRAEGFYSSFWHATYWYRKSDNLFLMYRSVQGLPGTNETIIELTEEPG